jgi:pimeloyl-ACP methyl ester carboxylesterase
MIPEVRSPKSMPRRALQATSAWVSRRFSPQLPCGELVKITTKDGHTLAIETLYPEIVRYKEPFIMSTGIVSNRNIYKIDGDTSFVEELLKAGNVVVLVDWRGHGESNEKEVTRKDTFRKLVEYDVDKIIKYVTKKFDAPPHWVGHSMGGMAIMAYLAMHTDKPHIVKSVTIIGSPTKVEARNRAIDLLLRAGATYNNTLEGCKLSKVNPISKASGLLMSQGHLIPESIYHVFFLALSELGFDNVRTKTKIRFIGHAIEPLFIGEMISLSRLVTSGKFGSMNRDIIYRDHFPDIKVPAFFIGAENDMLVTPQNVMDNFNRWGAVEKRCEIIPGFGHMGLLLGRDVQQQVWQPTIDWVGRHSTPL